MFHLQIIEMFTGKRVLINEEEMLGSPVTPHDDVTISKTTANVVGPHTKSLSAVCSNAFCKL